MLIVDEAHAYDAYMGKELERLIAFQAALGGSTIVLSATLPKAVKAQLATAWSRALRVDAPTLASDGYPCVTLLAPGQAPVEEEKLTRTDLPRALKVERLPDAEAAVERIIKAAQAGAAVAWVRNTVDDVIAGAALLRARGIDAQIFHARFAMGDRLKAEDDVVRRLGTRGTDADRRSHVLVASQVIEQSLDIDLDLMVSDLAPIDLLLQRAGRLWRHTWRTRPIAGPALLVVSPDPAGQIGRDWYRDAFPLAASVYQHPLVLWRTAQELFTRGTVRVPQDVRELIEVVYGPELETGAPGVLVQASNQARGKANAERSFADQNLLKVEDGYAPGGTAWANEGEVATRLAEETRKVRLAVEETNALRPWHADPDPRLAWALSELTVRARKLKGRYQPLPRLAAAAEAVRATWGKFDQDVILLPLIPAGNETWTGTLIDNDGSEQALHYSTGEGLQFD